MARQCVVQECSNAAADSCTGYQVNKHFRKNGSAAIENYGEPEVKKVKAPDFRLTSEKTIDRLEKHRSDLEAALESGKLSFERYDILLRDWQSKMDRAWKRHEKAIGESYDEEPTSPTPYTKPSVMNAVEDVAKGFAAKHPFAFLVASIMVGASVLNIFGFGA